jgi:hypothetical protein
VCVRVCVRMCVGRGGGAVGCGGGGTTRSGAQGFIALAVTLLNSAGACTALTLARGCPGLLPLGPREPQHYSELCPCVGVPLWCARVGCVPPCLLARCRSSGRCGGRRRTAPPCLAEPTCPSSSCERRMWRCVGRGGAGRGGAGWGGVGWGGVEVVARVCAHLFSDPSLHPGQVWKERVYDLLASGPRASIPVHDDVVPGVEAVVTRYCPRCGSLAHRNTVVDTGPVVCVCVRVRVRPESHSVDSLLALIAAGSARRVTKKTGMNEHSSRSHALLTLTLVWFRGFTARTYLHASCPRATSPPPPTPPCPTHYPHHHHTTLATHMYCPPAVHVHLSGAPLGRGRAHAGRQRRTPTQQPVVDGGPGRV